METNLNKTTRYLLSFISIVIGWHFLYEGLVKVFNEGWTAKGFLLNSFGFLSSFYHSMASNEVIMQVVDFANIFGLILIGIALILGVFMRFASLSGVFLMLLYYFAYPPFGNVPANGNLEGHFWIVNRNLIEAMVLLFIFFLPVNEFSILNLFRKLSKAHKAKANDKNDELPSVKRREIIKGLATLPVVGGIAYSAVNNVLTQKPDGISGATYNPKNFDLKDLKGEIPKGRIGNLEISRLIAGCNQIVATAHARDLDYVRRLYRAYNNEAKIFETLELMEAAGINTTNMVSGVIDRVFNKYKKATGSKMISICQTLIKPEDPYADIKRAIDAGATTPYMLGGQTDELVKQGKVDEIGLMIEYIRSQGYLAGIGAHSIQVPIACQKAGIVPDYYYKTMHHDNYWSAQPREFRKEFSVTTTLYPGRDQFHDNIFDLFPEQTIEFFKTCTVPLVGFKVLAAGAIKPEDGFRYAFENGADFICVGMFDFQVIEDANLVADIFKTGIKRSRPWYS
jgi:uncharacterized membrane protein YphA (DoxX/SURF4 family)